MTILEKSSERKCKAIKLLVKNGEYSASYGLLLTEEFYDKGKLIEEHYNELAEYLEGLLEPETEEVVQEAEPEETAEEIEEKSSVTEPQESEEE